MKGKRIFAFFASVCLALVFIVGFGNADLPEFNVPSGDYPTIQAGIEAAYVAGGGIVNVAEGIYSPFHPADNPNGETFPIIMRDGVQLIGAGAKICILDAEGSQSVIDCSNIFNPATKIEGITIMNGSGTFGGGIACVNSSLTIVNNIIERNYAEPYGGGIYCASSNPIIANNIIIANSAHPVGGGIFVDQYSSATIINNVILDNGGDAWGGGVVCRSSATTIMNNIIMGSYALPGRGGGLYCVSAFPSIGHNNVYDNFPLNYSGCGPGPGDISVDPEFVDAANGDYHLKPFSPCVDAGTNSFYWSNDFEGHPRPLDGGEDPPLGPEPAMVDIGVDELLPPPVADAGPDQTVPADEYGKAEVTLDGSGSTDPDNEPLEYEWKDSLDNVIDTTAEVTVTLDFGEHIFTLTVSSVNGTGTDEVKVTVEDTTPPVPLKVPLPDVVGECSAEITTTPTASDNCTEGTIYGTPDGPLVYTAQGEYEVTWTYDDGNGNTTTQKQTVIVSDVTAPVPSKTSLDDVIGECSAEIMEIPTATDNCAEGTIYGTPDGPLVYTAQGEYEVTWTYNDGNGNVTEQKQTVVVDDVTAPVPVKASLDDVIGECSAEITEIPTATDNCTEGTIYGTPDGPLVYTEQGTYTVTWTYDDGNGNTTEQEQTVIVDDVTAPVPSKTSLDDVIGECSVEITTAPTATDNCVEGLIIGIPKEGTLPITFTEHGTHTVTWTYNDGNGNITEQTQTVKVEDITPPTIHLSDSTCVDIHKWKIANMLTVSATDNCTPEVEFVIDKVKILNKRGRRVWGRGIYSVVGNDIYVFPNGRDWSIVVTVTASDSNGNTTTESISKPLLQCNRWSAKMARLIRLMCILLWKWHRCCW